MQILGFSGTRQGMSVQQKNVVKEFLNTLQFDAVAHGDCIGADSEFHDIVENLFMGSKQILIFPPIKTQYRAYKVGDGIHKPKSYYERNRNIVDNSICLLATPKSGIVTGGTWYTINYALKRASKVFIIYPSGMF